jgi:hypothetical protein
LLSNPACRALERLAEDLKPGAPREIVFLADVVDRECRRLRLPVPGCQDRCEYSIEEGLVHFRVGALVLLDQNAACDEVTPNVRGVSGQRLARGGQHLVVVAGAHGLFQVLVEIGGVRPMGEHAAAPQTPIVDGARGRDVALSPAVGVISIVLDVGVVGAGRSECDARPRRPRRRLAAAGAPRAETERTDENHD